MPAAYEKVPLTAPLTKFDVGNAILAKLEQYESVEVVYLGQGHAELRCWDGIRTDESNDRRAVPGQDY